MNVSEHILADIPIGQEFWIIYDNDPHKFSDYAEIYKIAKGILVNVKNDMDKHIDGGRIVGSNPKILFQICHLKDIHGEPKMVYYWVNELYQSRAEVHHAFVELLMRMAEFNNFITTLMQQDEQLGGFLFKMPQFTE